MQLFVDVTETFRSQRTTGVQRVVRELARALLLWPDVTLVAFDFSLGQYRQLTDRQVSQFLGPQPKTTGRTSSRELPPRFRRALSWGLDLVRRFLVHPWVSLTRPTVFENPSSTDGPVTFLTAEVVGDRARGRRLKAWAKAGIGLVFVVHDLIPWTQPGLSSLHPGDFRRYLKLLSRAKTLVAVSETTLAEVVRWQAHSAPVPGTLTRVIRIYPGFEPVVSPSGVGPNPGAMPLFLCVGTIETRKNQHRIVRVLEVLWSQGRQFRFVFAGGDSPTSGPFSREFAALAGCGRSIEWKTDLTDSELDSLYRAATATIYLSGTEGFGLPVVESLARGTPCIASDRSAVGEVAREFQGCLMVDPETPGAWAQALEAFLDDPGLRDRLVASVRKDRIRPWKTYAEELRGELAR